MKKILALVLWLAVLGSPAWSQTVIYVDAGATGANNGSSWADAYNDLQVALDNASPGNQLWVAAGTYKPQYELGGTLNPNSRLNTFHFQTDVEVYGGFQGTETALSQRVCNPGNPTVLSGDLGTIGDPNDNALHVCYSTNLSDAFLIDCVTIEWGFARLNTTAYNGGGWYNMAQGGSSTPRIEGCRFQNNHGALGGGFYNDGGNGGHASPTFVNCTFLQNSAEHGAGMYNDGSSGESSPMVTGCLFQDNTAGFGGGAFVNGSLGTSNGIWSNCEFVQNDASFGGGLYIMADDGTARGQLVGCNFVNNHANNNGGAVGVTAVQGDAKTSFTDCSFEGNVSVLLGGAVWNHGAGPTFERCSFTQNNSGSSGGAMYNDGSNGIIANPRVTSCDFVDNTAVAGGGAMYNQGTFGAASPLVVLSKFIHNVASSGGALYHDAGGNATDGKVEATYYNCLFSRNACQGRGAVGYHVANGGNCRPAYASCSFSANTAGSGDLFYANQLNGGNSLVSCYNMASHGHVGTVATMVGGASVRTFGGMYEAGLGATCNGTCYVGGNPLYTNAAADDLTLQAGSPAIDVGLNAWILPQYPVDLGGNTRIQNVTVDLGAYESPGPPPCPRVIYVNGIATGGNNGRSWADAYTDLQSALAEARINPCTDTILIASGVYKPTTTTNQYVGFELVDDIEIYGGFPNTGNPWFPQRNLVVHETKLSGDIGVQGNPNDNSLRVVSAGWMGPGFGTVTLGAGTIVDGLSVINGQGGFQCHLVDPISYCNPVFRDVRFYDNQTNFLQGAAMTFQVLGPNTYTPPVHPLFERCDIENNSGVDFGAVYLWSNAAPSNNHFSPTFRKCRFLGNSSTRRGGAVGITGSAAPVFEECLFEGNHVTGGNLADGGGVIDCRANNTGASATQIHAVFDNCRMIDNHTTAFGGIMNFAASNGNTLNADFNNCTISGSVAWVGGVLAGYVHSNAMSTINFNNCIIWNSDGTWWQGRDVLNISTTGAGGNAFLNFRHTLVDAPSCANGTRMWRSGNYVVNCGPGMLYNVNPQFVNPGAGNYSLAPGSAAINAGSNALVPVGMTTDIAGNNRIDPGSGGIVDMGCYENFPGMVLRTAGTVADAVAANGDVARAISDILPYPNPVASVLHWDLGGRDCEGGLLLDAMGKVVGEWTGNVTELDMSAMAAGVYVLRLQWMGGGAVSRRVVKE